MKSKAKKISILLIVSITIALTSNKYFNSGEIQNVNFNIPKNTGEYNVPFIHIDGSNPKNWSWTVGNYSWCYFDNGYYIIENVTIDASTSPTGSGIYIENSIKDYFIIRNCIVFNAGTGSFDSGIKLQNTCNGTIYNNDLSNNELYGISLNSYCHNNSILENTANVNKFGIWLYDNCHYNNITGNTLNYNREYGLRLDYCDKNEITENTANYNAMHGIFFYWSEWNNVTKNNVKFNKYIGIYIRYFSTNNNIKNNTITRNDLGIMLDYSNYNNVTGNIIPDNNYCIYEIECIGNLFEYNDCSPSLVHVPIHIDELGSGDYTWEQAVNESWCTGSGTWKDPYIIEGLKISGFGVIEYCINVENSNAFFVIQNCNIYNSGDYGISLELTNNSLLINNNCSNNDYAGIGLVTECSNNTILGNTLNDNGHAGAYIYNECYNNTISGNTANNNFEFGISVIFYSNDTIITGNVANNNGQYGINLYEYCKNSKISNNIANNNGERGINFETDCTDNVISNNIANNNGIYGLYLDSICNYNILLENSLENNSYGISLDSSCSNNILRGNSISDNFQYGIYLNGGGEDSYTAYNEITENFLNKNNYGVYLDTDANNNTIFENFFLKNQKHAVDNGSYNKWNSTTIGNYWDNHTGPDTSPADGIVDIPYNITGSAGSRDYLPIAENGPPIIIIDSPDPGDLFGYNAPSFSVIITDTLLNIIWYTLDEGLHNYTFTVNGTISQAAWDAIPDGSITLKFYASDIPGNIGSAEVNIIKDSQAPNLIINFPTVNYTFGETAPFFNISVSDPHLDTIWYSLDGGTTNYIITANGTINQAVWAALAEGSVTITFYANDTLGNITTKEVNVIKNIQEGGLDPTIIIIIVVLSIIGGVAIVFVVYLILKKQKAEV